VKYIVADENGGKSLVKTVTYPKGLFCPLVAFVSHCAKAHLTDSGESGFRTGTVGGAKQKEKI
jgi:hypothetical protein